MTDHNSHPAIVATLPDGTVARWRMTPSGRPAPRIELYPDPGAMLDPETAPVADVLVYDHETGRTRPYTPRTLLAACRDAGLYTEQTR